MKGSRAGFQTIAVIWLRAKSKELNANNRKGVLWDY